MNKNYFPFNLKKTNVKKKKYVNLKQSTKIMNMNMTVYTKPYAKTLQTNKQANNQTNKQTNNQTNDQINDQTNIKNNTSENMLKNRISIVDFNRAESFNLINNGKLNIDNNSKIFLENAFIIGIYNNITISNYPRCLLDSIKTLRNTGHNIYLLLYGKISKNVFKKINYDWVKIINTNENNILEDLKVCNVLAFFNNNVYNAESNKILNKYLLCNKPIICNRRKETEKILGYDYFGLYKHTTINNKNNISKETNDILIILKYYYLNNQKSLNDIGILTIYDWCNTGYRYYKGLKANNIKCDMIKLYPTPCFDYGDQAFSITNVNNSKYYGKMLIRDTPCYYFEIKDRKLSKLIETFISKCKYIYFHAESLILLKNINYFNKFIICGAAGHPLRRKPNDFCDIFNPIVDGTLIQCPDLLNLNTKNEQLIYYGVDHEMLYNFKKTTNKLTIGHFSSNPDTKGSDVINKCIDKIISKYPNKFKNYFDKKINYDNCEQHEKVWKEHIKRYCNCDIYIETCKPYLNKYSFFVEYNNTRFGEWGNTCLEAAASGCIVITNSLTKDYYLKEYDYEYPLLIANNEYEIMNHLETINKMSCEEIDNLKLKFLDWVKNVHSLKMTGKRFIDKFLTNLQKNIYPSYKFFNNLEIRIKPNTNKFVSLVYLINNDNRIEFDITKITYETLKKMKIIFSMIDVSFIQSFDLINLLEINKKISFQTNNLFEYANFSYNNNKLVVNLKLKLFSSNMLIYIMFKEHYENNFNIINKSFDNLFLRSINNSCIISNKINDCDKSSDFDKSSSYLNFIFNKPHFDHLYKNIPQTFSSEEENKVFLIDKYILNHVQNENL